MIGRNRLFIIAAFAAFATPQSRAEDQDLASLHQFNGYIQLNEKTRLMLHSRVRFDNNISDFFQFRTGPIIVLRLEKRLQLQAGYYLVEQRAQRNSGHDTTTLGRGQIRVLGNGRFSVDWRNLLERHMIIAARGFHAVSNKGYGQLPAEGGLAAVCKRRSAGAEGSRDRAVHDGGELRDVSGETCLAWGTNTVMTWDGLARTSSRR